MGAGVAGRGARRRGISPAWIWVRHDYTALAVVEAAETKGEYCRKRTREAAAPGADGACDAIVGALRSGSCLAVDATGSDLRWSICCASAGRRVLWLPKRALVVGPQVTPQSGGLRIAPDVPESADRSPTVWYLP